MVDLDEFIKKHLQPSPQHKCFYHFTDSRNLPSIRKHGILSRQKLTTNGIIIPAPGGNALSIALDESVGMNEYVHLCFTRNHGMELHARNDGRIENVIYLQIRPEIIKLPGVMITGDVANKKGVKAEAAAGMLEKLDLEVVYSRTKWADPAIKERLKAAERYEVLIPDLVPADYILNLNDG